MRLSTSLLIPIVIGLCQAAVQPASVYILSKSWQAERHSTEAPLLTSEQARLVIAQRLGVSRYHNILEAGEDTLAYINEFGGSRRQLFDNGHHFDAPVQLVILFQGKSDLAYQVINSFDLRDPAFGISHPHSVKGSQKFVRDLMQQIGDTSTAPAKSCALKDLVNPFDSECFPKESKILFEDATEGDSNGLLEVRDEIVRNVERGSLEVLIAFLPPNGVGDWYKKGAYNVPEKPRSVRRQSIEEPLNEAPDVDSSKTSKPQKLQTFQTAPKGIIPFCHASADSCAVATNNCSGHGHCYKKHGTVGENGGEGSACFSCLCTPTVIETTDGRRTTTWAGAACSKVDISAPFWLLAGFSVILIGLVSWAIGMMFAIGEEKLPGVIGAGVSGPKAR